MRRDHSAQGPGSRGGAVAASRRAAWGCLALALSLGVGCAAQAPAAQPASIQVEPAPELEGDPDVTAEAPSRTRECIVAETKIDGYIRLRFELHGSSLAVLREAAARLPLNSEPRVVELEQAGVMLRTPYDEAERPLRLRRALALGGVVTPKPNAEILALSSSPQGQVVRFVTGIELGHAAIEQALDCADITLNAPRYHVQKEAAIEGVPVQLMGKFGVSATPGGAATLQLDLGAGLVVDELERKAGQVKIRLETYRELLLGWVPESAVGAPRVVSRGGGTGSGVGFGSRSMKSHIRYVSCAEELTLFAERESRLGEVGLVRAETPFEIGERLEGGPLNGFSVVNFWQRWIVVDPAARFMVRSDELVGCGRSR